MEETKEIIISIAEVKVLWLVFGAVIGFILCEIKYNNKWGK